MYFLEKLDAMLGNEDIRRDLSDTPQGRAKLQRGIAFGEDGINFLIALRTRELLGLPLVVTSRRWRDPPPAKPRPFAILMRRYTRMRASMKMIERYARRRAARIMRMEGHALSRHAIHDDGARFSAAIITACRLRVIAPRIRSPPVCLQLENHTPLVPQHHLRDRGGLENLSAATEPSPSGGPRAAVRIRPSQRPRIRPSPCAGVPCQGAGAPFRGRGSAW